MRTFLLNSILYSSLLISCLNVYGEHVDQEIYPEDRQQPIEKRNYAWPDGRNYEGEWTRGAPHGQGMLTFPDGGQYWGRFSRGKRQGEGMMKYGNGDEYEGEWFNDAPQGSGTLRYSNGDHYEGQFEHAKKSGKGRQTFADGTYYDGQWLQNAPHGFGQLTFSSGGSYEGEFNKGQPEGHGLYKFANGDRYDGEWKRGKQDGVGRFEYSTGGFYEGDVAEGQREGQGVWVTALGQRYEGTFKANKAEGRGLCGTTGALEPCTYHDGKRVTMFRPDAISSAKANGAVRKTLATPPAPLPIPVATHAPKAPATQPKRVPAVAASTPAKAAIRQPAKRSQSPDQSVRFAQQLNTEKTNPIDKPIEKLQQNHNGVFFHDNWAGENLMALPGQAGWKKHSSLLMDQLEIISRHGDMWIRMLVDHYKGPGHYHLSRVIVESPNQSFDASSDEAGDIEIMEDAQGWISGKFHFDVATENGRKFAVTDGVFRISTITRQSGLFGSAF